MKQARKPAAHKRKKKVSDKPTKRAVFVGGPRHNKFEWVHELTPTLGDYYLSFGDLWVGIYSPDPAAGQVMAENANHARQAAAGAVGAVTPGSAIYYTGGIYNMLGSESRPLCYCVQCIGAHCGLRLAILSGVPGSQVGQYSARITGANRPAVRRAALHMLRLMRENPGYDLYRLRFKLRCDDLLLDVSPRTVLDLNDPEDEFRDDADTVITVANVQDEMIITANTVRAARELLDLDGPEGAAGAPGSSL